jgi:hypothetical protein
MAERSGVTVLLAILGIIAIAVSIYSYVHVHIKTGLWKLVHANPDNLDERQIMVTHESLRFSYGIFSVICLSIFLASELIRQLLSIGSDFPLIPVIAVLIYLAHTLPSSIIAWCEKEV